MKEEAIARALCRKDPDAMYKVMQKYSRLLWPIADAILEGAGTTQDVEECVADVFIQLWEYPEKFDPNRGSLKSYLCILTRSRALDRFRQLTRHSTVSLEEVMLTTEFHPEDKLLARQLYTKLHTLIVSLEEPARDVLLRRYFYDQKPRQIALALDMPVRQVNDLLYRTKKHLRQQLQQEGEFPWDA